MVVTASFLGSQCEQRVFEDDPARVQVLTVAAHHLTIAAQEASITSDVDHVPRVDNMVSLLRLTALLVAPHIDDSSRQKVMDGNPSRRSELRQATRPATSHVGVGDPTFQAT